MKHLSEQPARTLLIILKNYLQDKRLLIHQPA